MLGLNVTDIFVLQSLKMHLLCLKLRVENCIYLPRMLSEYTLKCFRWFCIPPLLRQCIATFAVTEGWLLFDIG